MSLKPLNDLFAVGKLILVVVANVGCITIFTFDIKAIYIALCALLSKEW
jgi:hypothetical protein